MTRIPDFFDRSKPDGASLVRLRCRECDYIFVVTAGYANEREGKMHSCHRCLLPSRIPTAEEAMWGEHKNAHDSNAGLDPVERKS